MREIEPRPAQCVLNRPAPPHTHDTQRMPQTNKTQNQKALLVLKSLHTTIKRQRLVFLHTSARHHSETVFWPKFAGVHKEGKIKKGWLQLSMGYRAAFVIYERNITLAC